jgi:hypothetical protein
LAPALAAGIMLVWPTLSQLPVLNRLSCLFHDLTGLPCPFCGLTRSFRLLAAGHPVEAVLHYPLSPLLALVLLLTLVSGMVFFLRPDWRRSGFLPPGVMRRNAGLVVVVLFAANWLYRLAIGLD